MTTSTVRSPRQVRERLLAQHIALGPEAKCRVCQTDDVPCDVAVLLASHQSLEDGYREMRRYLVGSQHASQANNNMQAARTVLDSRTRTLDQAVT